MRRKLMSSNTMDMTKVNQCRDDTKHFDSDLLNGLERDKKRHSNYRYVRMDDEPVKRVELHCHTKLSEMDAVADVREIVKTAMRWGHKAIAITDHGGVQALPDAWFAVPKDSEFKIICGCEAYLVDDEVPAVVNGKSSHSKGITTLEEVNIDCRYREEQIRRMHYSHIILLAQNEIGRVNLYRCVSESHLKHMNGERPLLPKCFLSAHREGLIIGSACERGELFQAIERGASQRELKKLVDYYDYLEVQPLGNNAFLTVPRYDSKGTLKDELKTMDDLREFNRTVVRLGEQYGKPVVATSDAHFLNPEDAIYRKILMVNAEDDQKQPLLYLRTTKEMLEEFAYLGEDKAKEVVITNTNLIADRIEFISPVRLDRCLPVIPKSDEILRCLCYDKAHEIYGENLPQIVKSRLEKELKSIISSGFSTIYIIAQKLVQKSVEDGYPVGFRGAVGSSFAANMAGITEVNPLHPHYLCPACHFVDFDSELVRQFGGGAGCDMPDRECPHCGVKLLKLGFDIPAETFLGFMGNKEPDIDLNFSKEYQTKAHDYIEVLFGKEKIFCAGTVITVASKTAYGFVRKYFENEGENRNRAKFEYLSAGLTGVKQSSRKHPGGVFVLPDGEEIYSFTPLQHPSMDESTVTTHFDYHIIDHNLLKVDILSHSDLTMIHLMEEMTGVNAMQIPLDDRKVMSLFQGTKSLGITPEAIGGCLIGSLGINEFGTEFAIRMLKGIKPESFSDLVRITALAHGTNSYLGNAQDLIESGGCAISTAICTRDDIMMHLISKGLDPKLSFSIMEKVRKGKGLTPEWEEALRAYDVPEWYIESCKKIKYLFPKAHAISYVLMAWRIAWFKIYEPLAFYATYFTMHSSSFDYDLMCMGPKKLYQVMEYYEEMRTYNEYYEERSACCEKYEVMKVVREMYARGYEFIEIDPDRCNATKFCVIDGKIMPSFNMIERIGRQRNEACHEGGEGFVFPFDLPFS